MMAICFFVCTLIFIKNSKSDKIEPPSITAWATILLAVILALATFIANGKSIFDPDGALFVLNVLGTVSIFTVLLLNKKRNFTVSSKDKKILTIVPFIVVYWFITGDAFVSNLCLQAILTVGFILLINKMIEIQKKIDTYSFWICAFVANALSFPLVYSAQEVNTLSLINSWRAGISVTAILVTMVVMDLKNKSIVKN
ncbi:hypothetical protein A2996_03040 [Candidatus Campbellbacteria bacterium RIFCSPLOWO2_01_FULL_34_15]|uniref:Uncharacterized protein n=1 Tax=Candidatus Campbellbacteria bacterium RIFCSPLOWO2_01_FULL_34_15 TaxID=1797579 RepID=A0A1F5EN44_9BACT|nr:MAG: hypothetical protein A2996_03040 [Candidatus Campbellbacteria bacterium RIFCSPLOWO2_01_FULL_34_15]